MGKTETNFFDRDEGHRELQSVLYLHLKMWFWLISRVAYIENKDFCGCKR